MHQHLPMTLSVVRGAEPSDIEGLGVVLVVAVDHLGGAATLAGHSGQPTGRNCNFNGFVGPPLHGGHTTVRMVETVTTKPVPLARDAFDLDASSAVWPRVDDKLD